jgi:hypothetical protein
MDLARRVCGLRTRLAVAKRLRSTKPSDEPRDGAASLWPALQHMRASLRFDPVKRTVSTHHASDPLSRVGTVWPSFTVFEARGINFCNYDVV